MNVFTEILARRIRDLNYSIHLSAFLKYLFFKKNIAPSNAVFIKLISCILFLFLFNGCLSDDQSIHKEAEVILPLTPLQKKVKKYEAFAEQKFKETATPGAAIVIVKGEETLLVRGFGVKGKGSVDQVDEETAFRLASVSKGFAPILAGLLVHEGLLSWDDQVIKHLPDFKLKEAENTEALTIRNVLSHTTGLPRHAYTNLIEEGRSWDDMRTALGDVDRIGKVGKHYSYQNVVYSLIGDVIEKVTGRSYNDLMEERVFEPLNMNTASITYEDMKMCPNAAAPHNFRSGVLKQTEVEEEYYRVAPAAGVNASANDMAEWLKTLMGHRPEIIDPSILKEIYKPVIRTPRRNRHFKAYGIPMSKAHYGMGWRILEFPEYNLIHHSGYANGFKSEVAFDYEKGIGIAVLSNAPTSFAGACLANFFAMFEE